MLQYIAYTYYQVKANSNGDVKMYNNSAAIKSELAEIENKLSSAADKFDIHFLSLRKESLIGQLNGAVAKCDEDYSCND